MASIAGASRGGGQRAGSDGRAVTRAAPPSVSRTSSRTIPSPAAKRRMSGRALQPFERLQDLDAAAFRLLALLFLAVDDLLGRALDEVRVVQLRVDALDVGVDLGDFLLQPR